MKKIYSIIILGLLLIPMISRADDSFSLSPATGSYDTDEITITCNLTGTEGIILFMPDGSQAGWLDNGTGWCGSTLSVADIFGIAGGSTANNGDYRAVYAPNVEDCTTGDPTPDYTTCLSASGAIDKGVVFHYSYVQPFSTTNLAMVFSTATSTFAETTGMEYTEVTDWSNTMLKLIIGNGLGILSNLLPWIIAIVIMLGAMAFIFRWFRFMRH